AHHEARQRLEAAFGAMLEKDAWHHPLFFCHNRWDSSEIADSVWRSAATKAVATLHDDGGVFIERYAALTWWRPVWTLDMLVIMKDRGLVLRGFWAYSSSAGVFCRACSPILLSPHNDLRASRQAGRPGYRLRWLTIHRERGHPQQRFGAAGWIVHQCAGQ